MLDKIVPVDKDLCSTLLLGTYSFPAEIFYDNLDEYANNFVNWHQQKQVEISLILEGEAEVQVLEKKTRLRAGEAFLIFPDALHALKKGSGQTVRYRTIIFDPVLLYGYKGSFYYEKYYRTFAKARPFYHFADTGECWEKEAVENLSWIFAHFGEASPHRELLVCEHLQRLWLLLCENLFDAGGKIDYSAQEQQRTAVLLNFLHEHYREKFTLEQLAASAHISKGECCRFFKKMVHMTPWEYLLEYRLSRSMELLEKKDLNISEIAEMTGFCTVSYYITAFKRKTGDTPLEYRKKRSISALSQNALPGTEQTVTLTK